MSVKPEIKRYIYRLTGVMLLYVAALVGANLWFRHAPPQGALAYVVAILPAVPVLGVFIVIGRLLMELRDEYMRMLLVRQSLVATGFALSAVAAIDFLKDFGLVAHSTGHYAVALWFAGWGVGAVVNALLERRAAQ